MKCYSTLMLFRYWSFAFKPNQNVAHHYFGDFPDQPNYNEVYLDVHTQTHVEIYFNLNRILWRILCVCTRSAGLTRHGTWLWSMPDRWVSVVLCGNLSESNSLCIIKFCKKNSDIPAKPQGKTNMIPYKHYLLYPISF